MHFPFMCFKVQLRPSLWCFCTVQCKNLFRCLSPSSLSKHTSQNNVHTGVGPDDFRWVDQVLSDTTLTFYNLLIMIHAVDKLQTCYSLHNTNKIGLYTMQILLEDKNMVLVMFLLHSWNILKLMNLVHAYSRCVHCFLYTLTNFICLKWWLF